LIILEKKVLISVGKLNFPEDVAETFSSMAEVIYPSSKEYGEHLAEVEVVIVGTEPIDEGYLDGAPKLKLVSRYGVGYDSVDVESCTRRGIPVTHTPGVLSEAVADHTWALILGLYRKIPQADRFTREQWALMKSSLTFGSDLFGKTLGIIGLGAIGSEVAKRAQGFGLKVIYSDVLRRPDLEREYDMEYCSFEELLKISDIVTLHVPLMPETKGLIGEKELDKMKPTAVLINTSRGPVIDQSALEDAIESGKIGGAALDVFDVEPIPLSERLLKLDNVLVSPHIASATWETRRKMALSCAESVRKHLEGKIPEKLVPEQRGIVSNP